VITWVVLIPPEVARAAGVAEGSHVALAFKGGKVEAEILPPASEELNALVERIAGEFGDAFAELKRRGD
jgi:antitoxin component of MazEF toxin-antitoxin module